MKLICKLTAVLSAVLLCGTTFGVMPAAAEELGLGALPEEPDWAPTDFQSAMEFMDTYGSTHIEDGWLCYVACIERTDYSAENPVIDTFTSGSFNCGYTHEYRLSASQEESGAETVSPIEGPNYSGYEYEVIVVTDVSNLDFDITHTHKYNGYIGEWKWSFSADAAGNITETDIYGWLPDSPAEYQTYLATNGNLSVHGNDIVYLDTVSGSTGSSIWLETAGNAKNEITSTDFFTEQLYRYVMVAGNSNYTVQVVRPTTAGILSVKWNNGRYWDGGEIWHSHSAVYEVGEDLSLTPITCGDINADGLIRISDAILLQRYLLGEGSLTDAQLAASDLNGDLAVNAADLTHLKHLLVESY